MKLLVTGGAGFIGSNFIHYWLKSNPSDFLINLDLLTYAGNLENLRDIEKTNNYKFVWGNIGNYELVASIFENYHPDVVINFAAESHNSKAIIHPDLFLKTNVLGTQILLEAAKNFGVKRFHHVSTCEVFGDLDLESQEKFTENSPYHPRTPYNASKAGADMEVRAYFETFHLPVTISICSNNYGPFQFPEKLIPHFVTSALIGKKLTLYEHSKNRREWLHVEDHCKAIKLIIDKGRVGETYNIGSGVEADVETIAQIVIDTMKLDSSIKSYVPDRPGHDRRYLLDSTKIRKDLGWSPEHEFNKGIQETIHWYENNKNWWEPLLAKKEVEESKWQ